LSPRQGNQDEQLDPKATFYKFGKLWEIPPAAARLGTSLPATTQAFETLLTNLEPMYSGFITAHPRCPKDPDLPAIRYAIKEFMEEQAPSNFMKERWAASYDPARKVTYVSWFLGTVAYFLSAIFQFPFRRAADRFVSALRVRRAATISIR
jgi:hypothetical protein